MKTQRILALAILALGTMMALGPRIAVAQDEDPPGRVARLNFMSGSVSFQPGGEGDWVAAVPNRPLTTGDNLWTDRDSRAELHIGSTAIRLGPETSLTLLDLDDRTVQLRVSQGSVMVKVRHLDDGDTVEIDTPNLAFSAVRTGEYRIDVNGDGNQTFATVWKGRGEVTGGGYSYTVVAGQQARFSGTDELEHEISQLPSRDDFDNWAFSRDQREDRVESDNYISQEVTGYEDLDDYGHWRYVADYGPVWTPSGIASDWAPYRNGHWVWIEPWGWTWVEDEPWGFAPFHYGRWAYVENGWCWVPGPVVVRPVYAPALVAFIGGPGGFVIAGGPGVAWFPLAPREVFVPWYRGSRGYVTNVNVTNTRVNVTQVTTVYNTYITNNNVTRITYVNQRRPGAVTAVTRDTFVNARPVYRNVVRVNDREIADARVSREIQVQPVRASVLGAGAPARVRPPAAVMERKVVATRNPTPPRAPFEQRQATNNMIRTAPPARSEPQPGREPNEAQRPPEPGGRGNQPAPNEQPIHPAEPRDVPRPPQSAEPREAPQAPRAAEPARPEERQVPHPAEPARPEARPDERQAPRSPQAEGGRPAQPPHPLVRPAPPVQERPERQQSEENKFRTWQEQRPKAAPAQPARPAPQPPQQNRPQNRQQDQRPEDRPH